MRPTVLLATILAVFVFFAGVVCAEGAKPKKAPKPPAQHHQTKPKAPKPKTPKSATPKKTEGKTGKPAAGDNKKTADAKAKAGEAKSTTKSGKSHTETKTAEHDVKSTSEKKTTIVHKSSEQTVVVKKSNGVHEPQGFSDLQLRQARGLLMGPLSEQSLRTARNLLNIANHDYAGHRGAAVVDIHNALKALPTNRSKAAAHVRHAVGELNTALSIR